ncbi:MAG TPA: hypothetical protein VIL20_02635 [Sandaracinaceae bacterium]
MSTPIKPPGGPPGAAPSDGPDAARVEGRPGELRELVEEAFEADRDRQVAIEGASTSPLGSIQADLMAGRIDVDQAIDRLVDRAIASASALPAAHRAALEAQLRAALVEDPTLAALRKDLERGSRT